MITETKNSRIATLDSLRGFAALSVVLGHITGGFYLADAIHRTPLYILRAGHEAVIFFFMLSGYVLVYQHASLQKFHYGKFLIQRFFRLYIPYIISIALAYLLFSFSTHDYPNPVFIRQLWQSTIDMGTIKGHLLLIGNFNTSALNGVIWSLVVEMRFALLFPLAIYMLNFNPRKLLLCLFLITLISASAMVYFIFIKQDNANGYIVTPYYWYIFLAGGYIAKNQKMLLKKVSELKKRIKFLFVIAAIIFYTYAHLFTFAIANRIYIPGLVRSRFLIEDFLIAVAAFTFIIGAISINNTDTILKRKFPLFLGKISYSLYLLHLPILSFFYFSFRHQFDPVAILAAGFFASIMAAIIFNKYVEQRSARWSKQLLKKYFP